MYSVAKTIADSFKYRNKIALDVTLQGSSRATSPNRSAVGVSRVVVKSGWRHRSENVAFDAVSCATVPISNEGGPAKAHQGINGSSVAQSNCQNARFSRYLRCLEYTSSNQGVRGSNPFGRTFYQKVLRQPGPRDRNEQIEPLTDNKTVRLPGAAPGWTSPLQRRRSGAKRRTSGAAASTAPQRR